MAALTLAWKHRITEAHGVQLREQAGLWRSENPQIERGGYVLALEREIVGWTCDLLEPRGWLAGCIAVPFDESEGFFIAVGGNRQDGAERWEKLEVVRITPEQKKSALDGFIAMERARKTEQREAVALAVPALERLCQVLRERSGQPKHLRGLLYSLWNGQAVSLTEILTLDWAIKKDFCAVMLAFGFEAGPTVIHGDDSTPDFFYDAIKKAVTAAGQWDWFLEAHIEEGVEA